MTGSQINCLFYLLFFEDLHYIYLSPRCFLSVLLASIQHWECRESLWHFCCVFDTDYIDMLIVDPSKRRKLNILQNNFCNGDFVIINYDGTVLSGCFAKENRNAVTGKVSNLINDHYCEFIIIYFIWCSNTHKKATTQT